MAGILLFALIGGAGQAVAGDELDLLREQLRELQQRVERLEHEIAQGVPVNPARAVQPVPGGWREAANWRLLAKDMVGSTVRDILGEPQSQKTVNAFEFWGYGDGKVSLYKGRLKSWELPSSITGR